MYTSFTIENFRCFENLTVGPLARVNLIAGQNNVGKDGAIGSAVAAQPPYCTKKRTSHYPLARLGG